MRFLRRGSYSPLKGTAAALRGVRNPQRKRNCAEGGRCYRPCCDRREGRLRESYNRFITVRLFTVTKGDIQMLNVEVGTVINRPIEEE